MNGDLKTWEDIERAALNDVFLYRMVTMVCMGHVTREQALIQTVLALADSRATLISDAVERLKNAPYGARPIDPGGR